MNLHPKNTARRFSHILFNVLGRFGVAAPEDGRTPFRRGCTKRFATCLVKEQLHAHAKIESNFRCAYVDGRMVAQVSGAGTAIYPCWKVGME
jgi:hypothetical protein